MALWYLPTMPNNHHQNTDCLYDIYSYITIIHFAAFEI